MKIGMDNAELKVNIGLPTYNRAELLPVCVKSVLDQSYHNWELIISDDNSSDATPEVAQSLLKLDSRIRYVRRDKRMFLPKNRNSICSLASSTLIFFIEDDLTLEKDCLKNLVRSYQELSSSKKIAAITPRMIDMSDNRQAKHKIEEIVRINKWTGMIEYNWDISADTAVRIITGHACSLLSKEAWQETGGYEEERYKGTNWREETDLYLRMGQQSYEIYFEPEAIVYHHVHAVGGCRSSSRLSGDYFFSRNHIYFLLRFYKLKSIYAIPLFILYLGYKLILRTAGRR